MQKLLIPLLLNSWLLANCTTEEEQKAFKLWSLTIHQKDDQKKIDALEKASKICPLPQIAVDGNIAYFTIYKEERDSKKLKNLESENAKLEINQTHIINNQKKINRLFGREQESGLKAIEEQNGVYSADILFKKNSATLQTRDSRLIEEILEKIKSEVDEHSDALFGFEGGASSDGNASYNQRLSQRRANALKNYMVSQDSKLQYHIETSAKGERNIICKGGFLAEVNPRTNEAECITQEDREASRRVIIRRKK